MYQWPRYYLREDSQTAIVPLEGDDVGLVIGEAVTDVIDDEVPEFVDNVLAEVEAIELCVWV